MLECVGGVWQIVLQSELGAGVKCTLPMLLSPPELSCSATSPTACSPALLLRQDLASDGLFFAPGFPFLQMYFIIAGLTDSALGFQWPGVPFPS